MDNRKLFDEPPVNTNAAFEDIIRPNEKGARGDDWKLSAARKRPLVRKSKRAGMHYIPPARRV